jgi:bla regulator protein BlaR1
VAMLLRAGLGNAVVAVVLALGAALVGWWGRRPALAHGLWLLVLLKLIAPPLAPVPVGWLAIEGQARAVADEGVLVTIALDDGEGLPASAWAAPEPAGWKPPPWRPVVLSLWLAGSGGWVALAAWRIRSFARLLRHAAPAPQLVRERAEELARRLDLRRCPEIGLLPGCLSPMLWALGGSPRLFLPIGLWEQLNDDQRDALLAHELAHLKRGDHWVRGLELIVTALYWWHPVLWWARRALREAEEQCCDAWVVWILPGSAKSYADALMTTVDFLSGARVAVPVAASGAGHLSSLKRRLTMILLERTPRSLSRSGRLTMFGLALALLPLAPAWAARDDDEPDKPPTRQDAENDQREAEARKLRNALDKLKAELQEAKTRQGGKKEEVEAIQRLEIKKRLEERIRAHKERAEEQAKRLKERAEQRTKNLEERRRGEERIKQVTKALHLSELSRAQDRLEWAERMAAKGYVAKTQVAQAEEALLKAKLAAVQDAEKSDGKDKTASGDSSPELQKAIAAMKAASAQFHEAQKRLQEAADRVKMLESQGQRKQVIQLHIKPSDIKSVETLREAIQRQVHEADQDVLNAVPLDLDRLTRDLKDVKDGEIVIEMGVPPDQPGGPRAIYERRIDVKGADQPSGLQVRFRRPDGQDQRQRLESLEKQLQQLRDELERLKREQQAPDSATLKR